ncbi:MULTISPECIES: hypothetical protein [unclassified Saccharopolyspora]|uniref:hypothetical protein n=1 Tax=unclassified Saccharopolyspora TaxID=2646250 RepID=UPI001CD56A22|nr:MULTISPECIES: hypothetical protein [unclassified Saccharopolyspora]MCA1189809.1 hypothetical protein [Saccharopolyspora sp. 6T]MCA1196077.1 hypothetical protein [Saccharopolyspora sp. 6V]MCA1226062.1 hypothetical protein [Saccharopolyspora sp. 6M]MCA1283137.1 hypothetical protein [Saccharopolyspora sp. 7B]
MGDIGVTSRGDAAAAVFHSSLHLEHIVNFETCAELLPAREALGSLNWADVYATNTAVAISGECNAVALANQDIDLGQKD